MAISDKLSKLKKAAERKKESAGQKTPQAREAARTEPKPAEKPDPEIRKPAKSAEAVKKAPEPVKKSMASEPAKKSAPAAPVAKKPAVPKPNLGKKIFDAVMADPRVKDYSIASHLIMRLRVRMKELESKERTIKELIDEELEKYPPPG